MKDHSKFLIVIIIRIGRAMLNDHFEEEEDDLLPTAHPFLSKSVFTLF